MNKDMPCHITDYQYPEWGGYTEAEAAAYEADRQERIEERVQDMLTDLDYLPDAISDGEVELALKAFVEVSRRIVFEDSLSVCRDVAMKSIVNRVTDSLRVMAEREIDNE